MITAMMAEIVFRKQYIQEKINTIYFGGGTPSLLEKDELDKLLSLVYRTFEVCDDAEVTIEVNPDDINEQQLKLWKETGFNRLSIGIQSFNDKTLHFLNRVHNSAQAISSLKLAQKLFDNINIDLIYAIPDTNDNQWIKDLETAISLKPQHISAYNLTIEEGTVFGNWRKKGRLTEADEEYAADQYQLLTSRLKAAGYEHYEVSNFCLPGNYSKHNTSYWQRRAYLGIGPGAHSYNFSSRQYNVSSNPKYIKALNAGVIPAEVEKLTREEVINEYLLTGLRTKWGIDINYMKEILGYEISDHQFIENILNRSLATLEGNQLILNDQGLLLADEIALKLSV